MRLADYVFDFLSEMTTVENCFFLSGGGAMHLNDALGKSRFQPVPLLHEQAAVIAADSSGRTKNDMGLALVTTGPGGSNGITGIAGSWMESTPLFVLTGQVSRATWKADSEVRQMGFQEIDIVSLASSVTKYAYTVTEPESIRYHLEKAVYYAKSGRPGPVLIDIPVDVQGSIIDVDSLEGFKAPDDRNIIDSTSLVTAFEKLAESKRPLLVLGHGIRLSGIDLTLVWDLIEKFQIPFQTTWNSMDLFPDDHPLNMGRANSYGHRAGNIIIQNSDFLLILGARMGIQHIGYNFESFAREAYKVMVDLDESELSKRTLSIDLPLQGDVRQFIPDFIGLLTDKEFKGNYNSWIDYGHDIQKRFSIENDPYYESEDFVDTYKLFNRLSHTLESGEVIVPASSGTTFTAGHQAFRIKKDQRYLTWKGLASMGYGLPAAIGASVESGNKEVWTITGDGGFQMNIQELAILAGRDLPVKLFVMNNMGYLSIRMTQMGYFKGHKVGSDHESGVYLPDLQKIAHAYGLNYLKMVNNSEIDRVINEAQSISGPVLVEVMVDPEKAPLPKLSSYKRSDGRMASRPLEDLAPLLPREELEEIMQIDLLET